MFDNSKNDHYGHITKVHQMGHKELQVNGEDDAVLSSSLQVNDGRNFHNKYTEPKHSLPENEEGIIVNGSRFYGDVNIHVTQKYSIQNTDQHYGTLQGSKDLTPETKLYKKRFLILFLFCLCTMLNGFQWIQYPSISNIVTCYYDVDISSVNLTSIIYMIVYVPLIFPIAWLMEREGLRFTLILAAAGNCLSSCVQCTTLAPDRFYMVLTSQTIAAIAQTFSLGVPPYLAALWFGSEEVSRACSVGVFGNQLGVAIGFLIPPVIVPHDCSNKAEIGFGLARVTYGLVAVNATIFFAILLLFKDRPLKPPSLAQANKPEDKISFFQSICNLMKNINFTMLFIIYGISSAVFSAISTLLNQMVIKHFPGKEVAAGWIGVLNVFAGMAGSVVCGYILDKTHKFRQTSLALYILSFLSVVLYTGLAQIDALWIQFVFMMLLGFFVTGYLPVGFEFGAEITYPEPEGTSAGLLNVSSQIFSIILTLIGSWLLQTYGNIASNIFFCGCLLLGCVISVFIKCDLRRRGQYKELNCLLEDAE